MRATAGMKVLSASALWLRRAEGRGRRKQGWVCRQDGQVGGDRVVHRRPGVLAGQRGEGLLAWQEDGIRREGRLADLEV